MAMLSGGGYAQYAAVHTDHLISIPPSMTYIEAASTTETFLTAYQILKVLGRVTEKDTVLIHAGASGVGTSAMQLCTKVYGCKAITVCSSDEKCEYCSRY